MFKSKEELDSKLLEFFCFIFLGIKEFYINFFLFLIMMIVVTNLTVIFEQIFCPSPKMKLLFSASRTELLIAVAQMTGNSKVMLGTSGNRLAVQMLSDIAQGRGAHVALNTVRVAYHFLSSFLYSKPYWKDFRVSERFCIKYVTLTY